LLATESLSLQQPALRALKQGLTNENSLIMQITWGCILIEIAAKIMVKQRPKHNGQVLNIRKLIPTQVLLA